MKTILFASLQENSGKTSVILGLSSLLKKKIGYLKPLGDKLQYIRKKNWDYDANLLIRMLKLECDPGEVTIGHNHTKLRFMYDRDSMIFQLHSLLEQMGAGKDLVFVEGGKDLVFGSSLCLDAGSLAEVFKVKVVFVVSGTSHSIVDQLYYIDSYISKTLNVGGVVINKVDDIDDFEQTCLSVIDKLDINLYGVIPFDKQLEGYTVGLLAEKLFAQIIAGDAGKGKFVSCGELVVANSMDEIMKQPVGSEVVLLTSGFSDDLLNEAVEKKPAAIIIANDQMPQPGIISAANTKEVPLLAVNRTITEIVAHIGSLRSVYIPEHEDSYQLLCDHVEKYINVAELTG